MPKLVWIDGVVSPLDSAVTTVRDHAFLYGDGLFEGIRIYGGKVFKLDEHLARLDYGAKMMGFEQVPAPAEVKKIVLDLCAQAGESEGYIRINLSRGTGLGLDPKNIDRKANLMVMVNTLNLYPPHAYDTGLEVVTCSYKVIAPDALDPRLKCIGRYACNIMAKQEANQRGAGEGLMLNAQGYVAECTGDNIFVVKNGVIYTPHVSCGILAGITRQTIIDLARSAGYTVEETFLTRFDIFEADEAFLTGTAAEVIGMVSLDGQKFGDGTPGRITKEMMTLFRLETAKGTPFLLEPAVV